MNRAALGLAVGAGYVLGRTKKMKLAFALGTLVAGKRLHLSPRALADLASQQLRDNPQFKEIGDQLRQDLRGVGKAASGAMVERQLDSIADRLHNRTSQVRDELSGAVPDVRDEEEPEELEESEEDSGGEEKGEEKGEERGEEKGEEKAEAKPRKKPTKKTAAAKKTTAQKTTAKKAPGGSSAPRRTAARKKSAPARGGSRAAQARQEKGGDER
ncbi:hypothetical protein Stsp02_52160 [Streptomyces sp. NBRC 14336]|uniref:DNA primase n=1 Tax=Streptomyces sp. NBRC 14336 TaxID=3030992 RepID=UPI0024A0473B|nr:DNA primase [Streptomyces sp. NBRC 14336]GLW49555.1 hypothetical protein Stsp02_52160 [Streptomyces sp. NBRC 14336]